MLWATLGRVQAGNCPGSDYPPIITSAGEPVPMADESTGSPLAFRRRDGAVMCPCGDRLADRIDGDVVVIDGMEFRFRRRSDEMTCRTCGTSHPVRQFRFGGPPPRDTGQRRRRTD
jgi:hypothetical protein